LYNLAYRKGKTKWHCQHNKGQGTYLLQALDTSMSSKQMK